MTNVNNENLGTNDPLGAQILFVENDEKPWEFV